MKIGKAFKDIREESGIKQREMAARLGMTPTALWKIENGKTFPKWKTMSKFMAEMHIPTAYFFSKAMGMEDYIHP